MDDATPPTTRIRRIADGTLALLFVVLIGLPLLDTFTGRLDPAPPVQEKRAAAQRPAWSWSEGFSRPFTEGFEAWWSDRFGFRDGLLRLDGLVAVLGLGVSTSPTAIVGRDGWFYLAEAALDLYRAARPFTDEQLAGWVHTLEARRDWLAERGCTALLVLAPNKSSVYPEGMPAWARPVGERTRTDQLVERLGASSDLELLDLRGVLRAARTHGPVYSRSDSHWNHQGAWVAYQAIAERLEALLPGWSRVPDERRGSELREQGGGDLAALFAVETFLVEQDVDWVLPVPRPFQRSPLPLPPELEGRVDPNTTFLTAREGGGLPRAVVLRDSFTTPFAALLAESFGRAAFVGLQDPGLAIPFEPALVEAERPDLVLTISVERMLMGPPPPLPRDVQRAWEQRRIRERGLPVFELDPESAGGLLHAARRLEVDGRLHVLETRAGRFVLPCWSRAPDEQVALAIDLSVPEPGVLRVFAVAPDGPEAPAPILVTPLVAGRQRLLLRLPPFPGATTLQLDPGAPPDRTELHALDVLWGVPRAVLPADGFDPSAWAEARVVSAGPPVTLVASSADPRLEWPEFVIEPGQQLVLLLDAEVPGDTLLQPYHRPQVGGPAVLALPAVERLGAGRNVRIVPLLPSAQPSRLRLDPGTLPGRYVLHTLEVWDERHRVALLGPGSAGDLGFKNLDVTRDAAGLQLLSREGDPQILVPAIAVPPGQHAVLQVDLSVDEPGALLVFCSRLGAGSSPAGRTLEARHEAGRNLVFVELPEGPLAGPLRIDPIQGAGRVTLHALALAIVRD